MSPGGGGHSEEEETVRRRRRRRRRRQKESYVVPLVEVHRGRHGGEALVAVGRLRVHRRGNAEDTQAAVSR